MTTCRWCGADLDVAAIPTRTWGGRLECASTQQCEKRRIRRQVHVALARRAD